jgi:hypothetical protein
MTTEPGRAIAERIQTHLFVVPLNNSGSSFLARALASCAAAISLRSEGQHVPGFAGPVPREQRLSFVWGRAETGYEQVLADPANYDWPRTREVWYAAARVNDPSRASVFVEKSPPHVARADMLVEHFPATKMIFLVRNPYAVAESIGRQRPNLPRFARAAAEHIVTCLRLQRRNMERWGDRAILLRYEDMCGDVEGSERAVRELVPAFDDLVLDQRLPVKGRYDETLRDMNADHLARLPPALIPRLSRAFEPHAELLAHFGYELL